jgi:hypothetical protein
MSQPNKYRAVATEYDGRRYHSSAEAAHARTLDVLLRTGKVKEWEPQVRIPLTVAGRNVCTYVADFRVTFPDGSIQLHEVKGYETSVWRLKRKLLEALYPDVDLRVVPAGRDRYKLASRGRG